MCPPPNSTWRSRPVRSFRNCEAGCAASFFRCPGFLIWYAVYVLLGAFAHEFMAVKVWGNVNVGLLIGLGQFVTTFAITGIYVRFANRNLDPRAAVIRADPESLESEAA